MSKKILILFAAFFTFGAVLSALAQDKNPGPVLGSSSAIDNQGVRGYLLGPGDVLDVRVFGQPDLSSTVEIDDSGQISSLPFLETPLPAQCRTEKEVQIDITKAYSKYIRNPQVSVRIAERKSRPPATISGAVRNPMQVTMLRRARLHELVTKAGGWTDRASGTIQIMHTQPEMCPDPDAVFQKTSAASTPGTFGIEVFKTSDLKMGKEEADPYIRPGDIVIVTEGEPVYITGAVMGARELVLKDQLTLGRAIAMAGGVQRLAKSNEIHIYRQKEGKAGQDDLTFNYDAIKKGEEKDVFLQAYDIVDVRMQNQFSPKSLGDFFLNMTKSSMGILPQRVLY
jgi:polysaccharide export outer membrane protein